VKRLQSDQLHRDDTTTFHGASDDSKRGLAGPLLHTHTHTHTYTAHTHSRTVVFLLLLLFVCVRFPQEECMLGLSCTKCRSVLVRLRTLDYMFTGRSLPHRFHILAVTHTLWLAFGLASVSSCRWSLLLLLLLLLLFTNLGRESYHLV